MGNWQGEIDNPTFDQRETAAEVAFSLWREKRKKREGQFLWLVSLVFLLMFGRLLYLQVFKNDHFAKMAEENRIKKVSIKAPRGIIQSQDGKILAQNIPSFDAVFVPADLPKDYSERKTIYSQLGEILTLNDEFLSSMIENADFSSNKAFLIKENIGYEKAVVLMEKRASFPGVYLEETAKREYPSGEIFSFVVGYDGKITKEELQDRPGYKLTDYIGKNGLEYSYENKLKGQDGEVYFEVDALGKIKDQLGSRAPVVGNTLKLHLEAGLQEKAYELLKKILDENPDATGASLVAIDPRDGGVLALVSLPSYDNNLFSGGISHENYVKLISDERKPMFNRSISGEYPPGSTFKPLIAAAALEENIIEEKTVINCSGAINHGSWVFPDWKTHGPTDLKKAIAESCDVYFYALGGGWNEIKGLSIDKMGIYARKFGLGDSLGVDLPAEAKGNIPDREWKFKKLGEKWYLGNDYHFSIGQGYALATPLQMANAIATIANGGKLFRPVLVDKIIEKNGREYRLEPELIRENFISRENLTSIQEGMRETVFGANGSGRSLSNLKVATAGKTGTAQFGADEKTHSWYVSYGPYENPEVALAVLVEGGGEGHSWAVPVSREIYRWYFDLEKGALPDEELEKKEGESILAPVAGGE